MFAFGDMTVVRGQELHGVAPSTVGLADFGRPEGFLTRQVRRWHGQWQASETESRAALPRLLDRLTEVQEAAAERDRAEREAAPTDRGAGEDVKSVANCTENAIDGTGKC